MNFLEGRAYRTAEVLTNLVVLNLLWLVACLPVITAFPATAAMFGVVREWIRDTDTGSVEPFIRHLKANFVQALGLGILWLLLGAVLIVDFLVVRDIGGWLKFPLYAVLGLGLICYALASACLFPVMVNFEGRWLDVIRNSLLISISQLGTSVLCIMLFGVAVLLVLYVPLLLLIAGSATAFTVYYLCARTFARIEAIKAPKRPGEDPGT